MLGFCGGFITFAETISDPGRGMNKLAETIDYLEVIGDPNVEVSEVVFDSRSVSAGALFVAVAGEAADGHRFIDAAVEKGAAAVVCQQLPQQLSPCVTYFRVADSRRALGALAGRYYDNPSAKLKLVAVTGTNGKTTTATLLYRLFRSLGHKAGLISTVSYFVDDKEYPSTHTTPDVLTLNRYFAEMVACGCEYCFMEVSSHSIVQGRIFGLDFDVAVFTNITHDHLDYHKTFENYIDAKKALFDSLGKNSVALYNADDRRGKVMVQNCAARIKSYSLKSASDYKCRILESRIDGMLLDIDGQEVWTQFIGQFNAYNALAVYAVAVELGVDKSTALLEISRLTSVSGRFEMIGLKNGSLAVVDYAHTPDALENVLKTVSELRNDFHKLFLVVGCGGNRDKTKRPVMAAIGAKYADLTLFTSDNPRDEAPEAILADMLEGVKDISQEKYMVITNRAEAIRTAVLLALREPASLLLVAGKGHENYQEIAGVKHHFDDREEIRKAIL